MLRGSLTAVPEEDGVEFAYELRPVGEAVDLTFRDGCQADVVVTAGEEDVWRYSEGRMFTQALIERTVEPDETLSFSFTWSDPEPGSYRATAHLRTMNGPRNEASTTFEI